MAWGRQTYPQHTVPCLCQDCAELTSPPTSPHPLYLEAGKMLSDLPKVTKLEMAEFKLRSPKALFWSHLAQKEKVREGTGLTRLLL